MNIKTKLFLNCSLTPFLRIDLPVINGSLNQATIGCRLVTCSALSWVNEKTSLILMRN